MRISYINISIFNFLMSSVCFEPQGSYSERQLYTQLWYGTLYIVLTLLLPTVLFKNLIVKTQFSSDNTSVYCRVNLLTLVHYNVSEIHANVLHALQGPTLAGHIFIPSLKNSFKFTFCH